MVIETSVLGPAYALLKDLTGWLRRRFHHLSPEERLALRDKWKELFREEVWKTEERDLRQDVIVRDVSRLDQYPESDERNGISSWFRVALIGQYHRGIELGLSLHSLVFEPNEGPNGAWRLADHDRDVDKETAYLVGYVRYEEIEQVDWNGDEYYNYPHIYCHFTHGGQPYEKLAFCRQGSVMPKHYFYTEIASYEEVRLTSFKYGTAKGHWRTT